MRQSPYRRPATASSFTIAADFERMSREGARRGKIRRWSGLVALAIALGVAAPAAALPHFIRVPRPVHHETTSYGRLPVRVELEATRAP